QPHDSQNNIALASREEAAGTASNGRLPQIGNQQGDWQSMNAAGDGNSTAPRSNQFDAARREAALLGLNAGPGQVFPYIQRYERVRTGDSSQSGGTQHAAGQPYAAPGAMPADSRSAVPAGQFQQGSPQQGSP